MSRQQIDKYLGALFAAQSAEQERTLALESSQAFAVAGLSPRVVFKRANRTEYLEATRFIAEKDAFAVILVGGEVYIWAPIDRKNVDAFFLE